MELKAVAKWLHSFLLLDIYFYKKQIACSQIGYAKDKDFPNPVANGYARKQLKEKAAVPICVTYTNAE